MIDRGDIRQAIDHCSDIWASLPGAGYGQFEHKADGLIAKFKEAGGTVRDWAGESQLSPLWLSASSSACHGLLIITVITPLPTKPSATKIPRALKAGERGNYWRAYRCVGVMLLRSMQNTRRLADAKAENDALRDDVAAGHRQFYIKQSSGQCVKPPPPRPSGMVTLPDWQGHRWTGLFHPQRELITMQKQLEGTKKYINEQCR